MLSSDISEPSNEAFGTLAATRPSQASLFKEVNVTLSLDMSLDRGVDAPVRPFAHRLESKPDDQIICIWDALPGKRNGRLLERNEDGKLSDTDVLLCKIQIITPADSRSSHLIDSTKGS
jgi:hypothetical protein